MIINDTDLTAYQPEQDLNEWTEASTVKESIANYLSLDSLTRNQWNSIREFLGLETRNIRGVWMLRYTRDEEPVVETAPPAKPSVVTFGDFSSSLAVVNNISTESIQVHNTSFSTGTLATEAAQFVNQLEAFNEFLDNTSEMLAQREQTLRENTRVKTEALHQTRLKVEAIRQRTLLAQRSSIAAQVENSAVDVAMMQEIQEGKKLHSELSQLDLPQ